MRDVGTEGIGDEEGIKGWRGVAGSWCQWVRWRAWETQLSINRCRHGRRCSHSHPPEPYEEENATWPHTDGAGYGRTDIRSGGFCQIIDGWIDLASCEY